MRMLAALAFLLLTLACAPRDPGRVVVAEIGEDPLTRAEMDASLAAALAGGSPLEGADRDRVHSRLLDALIDEKLLAGEAARRGVTVTGSEVAAYLADLPPEGRRADPEAARRHLATRKLQDALIRALGPPPESEVEALAGRLRAEEDASGLSVVLRALRVASRQEADVLRARLGAGETTFDREARARDPEAAAPLQVAIGRLPPEVGAALADLRPGEVTPPVRLHEGIYLFELVARGPQASQIRDLRAEAGEELFRRRGEMAVRAQLTELRRRTPVRIHRGRLGFRYVQEGTE